MDDERGWIIPDWSECGVELPRIRAMTTTRSGLPGVSRSPFDSFNLATHVGDLSGDVALNRQALRQFLPAEPLWLEQVHGVGVVSADDDEPPAGVISLPPVADACISRQPGRVCAIMTADCLPVLLAARDGSVVAAAHAGWRGLAAGVIEATMTAMGVPPAGLVAWLGPAIGARAFEVGDEVRAAFCRQDAAASQAFLAHAENKWLADLAWLARRRLSLLGVSPSATGGGRWCTFSDPQRFYSYRREGVTGRMATMIWITDPDSD